MRHRTVIFFIGVLVAFTIEFAIPSGAAADLALWFALPRAHWGQRIQVHSPERYAPFSGVRVYLVPIALARSARAQRPTGPPRNRRISLLGPLHLDSPGIASLSFTVPHVPPGDYTIGFWCRPCAPPAGAFFTTAQHGQQWAPKQRRILRIRR